MMENAEAGETPVETPANTPATEAVKDPLLKSTLAKVEASVPEKYQRGYDQILASGLQLMFADKTFPLTEDYLRNVKAPADVPKLVSHGIIKLLSILYNESQGKLQLEASGAAAIALMVHVLDYVDRVLKIAVTADVLAQTTELTRHGLMVFLKQASKLSDEDFARALSPKKPGEPAQSEPAAPPAEAPAPTGIIQGA